MIPLSRRQFIHGSAACLAYGNPCSVNLDPIEKKPLFHFKPRISAFSLATAGCNFRCLNCQNWEISQAKPHDLPYAYDLFPEAVIAAAQKAQAQSIAYTYSEPITFFEYMIDIGHLARQAGIYNLLIKRQGYNIPVYNLVADTCKFCGTRIPGIWHGQT